MDRPYPVRGRKGELTLASQRCQVGGSQLHQWQRVGPGASPFRAALAIQNGDRVAPNVLAAEADKLLDALRSCEQVKS